MAIHPKEGALVRRVLGRSQRDAAQRAIRRIADWAKDICVAPEDVK